ncbi:MAG: GyrI-like domain-containing protein [Proteobacteria bacterium]|nr:GyrI-like domain-containing protein [Pseudomonadota bacterium]
MMPWFRNGVAGVLIGAALAIIAAGAPRAQTVPPTTPNAAPAAPGTVPAAPTAPDAPPADAFGLEVMLTARSIVGIKGTATWDSAYETLLDTFKTIYGFIDRQGLKADGPAMTIYLSTDDSGFHFQAAVPISEPPKELPRGDIAVATSPQGKALKFVHRGSYDAMDNTYEAITNFLDEKRLEAKDLFFEQYMTDLRTTPEDKLVIEVYVPLK